jgi:hypothetical protein
MEQVLINLYFMYFTWQPKKHDIYKNETIKFLKKLHLDSKLYSEINICSAESVNQKFKLCAVVHTYNFSYREGTIEPSSSRSAWAT